MAKFPSSIISLLSGLPASRQPPKTIPYRAASDIFIKHIKDHDIPCSKPFNNSPSFPQCPMQSDHPFTSQHHPFPLHALFSELQASLLRFLVSNTPSPFLVSRLCICSSLTLKAISWLFSCHLLSSFSAPSPCLSPSLYSAYFAAIYLFVCCSFFISATKSKLPQEGRVRFCLSDSPMEPPVSHTW